ncbi:MAG TPA: cytochrome P450 [Gemmatimonas sp.]|nr:cytochrome P450 [Gemmatimonas sp.]
MRFPPGPKSRFPGDVIFRLRADFLGFLESAARDYGDAVGFSVGSERYVLLNHPELIRDVLVTNQRSFHKGRALEQARRVLGNGLLTSEGDFHLRQRRLVQPAFHRDRIAGYGAAMVACAERTRARWTDGTVLDMHAEMMRLTLAVVGKTLFGADVEGDAEEIGTALEDALGAFALNMLPFGEWLERLPLPAVRRLRKARVTLDRTIYRMIAERRAAGDDRGDLLSMLVHATDAEGDGTSMTDEQLRDEALTIFLAGHETTANALAWTWYLLAQHQAVAGRVHAEVDALGRVPRFSDVACLPYTRQVIAESMRLYPPAYAIGRRAVVPYSFGEYQVPARTIVLVSQYLQHRDARWFPDPERFDPDRWTPEAAQDRPKFSYFPFGAGTRVCVGEQFAWTEAVLLLATLAQEWSASLVPGHAVELQPRITLRPKHGVRMVLHRRAVER